MDSTTHSAHSHLKCLELKVISQLEDRHKKTQAERWTLVPDETLRVTFQDLSGAFPSMQC